MRERKSAREREEIVQIIFTKFEKVEFKLEITFSKRTSDSESEQSSTFMAATPIDALGRMALDGVVISSLSLQK